jgi:rhamnulokinase
MSAARFVAIDFGAESGRAMLGVLADSRLTLAEKHRFANPHGRLAGHLHWDVLAQWEQIKAGLRLAAGGEALDGVGVDTWGVDFALLGRGGELLGNPYMYRDGRTDGIMERTFARVSRREIFQATGLQFMQLNTLFQLLAMQEARSSALAAAQTLLLMADLFHYLLSGVCRSEYSIASTTQMLDPLRRTWATDLLARLDLPTHILTPIVPAGTVLGPLAADVAAECGVPACPVIAPASHDTASAVAAVPAEAGTDWCYISSGTWSLMGVELAEPVVTDKSLAYNYTNEGGLGGTIRFLKNIMGLWPLQECRRAWQAQGVELSYAEIARAAAAAPPLRALINLEHPPLLSPGDMPGKIARYCLQTGQQPPADHGAMARAIFESLALTYRRTIEGLEDILGRRIGLIHIVGGGSQNLLLNQMTADACARPVLAGPVEATAAGNVLVQALAAGHLPDRAAIRQVVRESFPVQRFDPRDTQPFEAAYARFCELPVQ